MTKFIENFRSIAEALYDEAPSAKAREFCLKVTEAIEAKGEAWIIENAGKLELQLSAEQWVSAPVEDNRLYWLTKWQQVLAGEK
jgi:hypothetical protein